MQPMVVSEASPLGIPPPPGIPLPPVAPVTRLRSPAAHMPPRELPELLKRSTTDEKVLFAPNIDGRLKITEPFVVTVQRHEGVVVAYVPEIEEFGYGSNSGEALQDLGKTLSELYFSLKENTDRLSADLRSVWLELNAHIQPRQT